MGARRLLQLSGALLCAWACSTGIGSNKPFGLGEDPPPNSYGEAPASGDAPQSNYDEPPWGSGLPPYDPACGSPEACESAAEGGDYDCFCEFCECAYGAGARECELLCSISSYNGDDCSGCVGSCYACECAAAGGQGSGEHFSAVAEDEK